jgi:hypothetical protein
VGLSPEVAQALVSTPAVPNNAVEEERAAGVWGSSDSGTADP